MGDLFASGGSSGYPAALDTATTQTDATPTLPFDATAARASKVNNLATALINIQTELGVDPAGAYADVVTRLDAISAGDGGYYSAGLTGNNNSGTPNTQYDFVASLVALRDPSATTVVIRTNTGTITNNVLTAGPAVNGRDQAGVFSASSWIHFYWIWNGTTLATVSSATAPPTGPTLPATYTHWAYIGAVYYSSGSALAATRLRGPWFTYDTEQTLLNNGGAVSETALDTSALCPPNAAQIQIHCWYVQITSNGSGVFNLTSHIRVVTGVTFHRFMLAGTAGASATQNVGGPAAIIPNVGQNIYYIHVIAIGTSPLMYLYFQGYSVPNGAS